MLIHQAINLANELMQKHIPHKNYVFTIDYAKRRCGKCNYRKKEISLSRYYIELNSEENVRNTILHEIAHAMVGPGHGHGLKWKLAAKSIGCTAERCGSGKMPEGNYVAICRACERKHTRIRRPRVSYLCACLPKGVSVNERRLNFEILE